MAFKSAERLEHKESKTLHTIYYSSHNLWPHSIDDTIKENQIVGCQYSTGLLLLIVVVTGDGDCDGDGPSLMALCICLCVLSVKFRN